MFWPIFWTFFKVGIYAYGGGQSMIPLLEQEVVESRKWMTITEFGDVLALGNGLPGPITTKMAVAIGYKLNGFVGAAAALFALLFPSTVLMFIVIWFFFSYKDSPRIQSMLRGLRPAVVALLAVVAFDLGKASINNVPTSIIAIVTFAVFAFTKLHPAIGMAISGLIGMLFL
jgi:chromate transporter